MNRLTHPTLRFLPLNLRGGGGKKKIRRREKRKTKNQFGSVTSTRGKEGNSQKKKEGKFLLSRFSLSSSASRGEGKKRKLSNSGEKREEGEKECQVQFSSA